MHHLEVNSSDTYINVPEAIVPRNPTFYKKVRRIPRNTMTSVFLITLNTNISFFEDEHVLPALAEAVEYIPKDKMNFRYILKQPDRDEGDRHASRFDYSQVYRIDMDSAVEVGPKFFKVHTHILLRVHHNTRVHVNRDGLIMIVNVGINEYYRRIRSPKHPDNVPVIHYCNIQVIPDGVGHALRYFDKPDAIPFEGRVDEMVTELKYSGAPGALAHVDYSKI